MQQPLQQPQQPMPEGSSESNFAAITSQPETIVTPEQLSAADTASARDLVEMAYGGTVAVSAETTSQQEYIEQLAPVPIAPGNAAAEASRVVADTEVIRAASMIGQRLTALRAGEVVQDISRGDYDYAA